MNRRGFLKLTSYGVALCAAPVIVGTATAVVLAQKKFNGPLNLDSRGGHITVTNCVFLSDYKQDAALNFIPGMNEGQPPYWDGTQRQSAINLLEI